MQTFIYTFHGWLLFSPIILLSLPFSSHSFTDSLPPAKFECHSIQLHSMWTNIKWFKISVIIWMDHSRYSLHATAFQCLKQSIRRTKSHAKEILISQNTELINLTGDEAFVNLISVIVNVERTAQHSTRRSTSYSALYSVLCVQTNAYITLVLHSIH